MRQSFPAGWHPQRIAAALKCSIPTPQGLQTGRAIMNSKGQDDLGQKDQKVTSRRDRMREDVGGEGNGKEKHAKIKQNGPDVVHEAVSVETRTDCTAVKSRREPEMTKSIDWIVSEVVAVLFPRVMRGASKVMFRWEASCTVSLLKVTDWPRIATVPEGADKMVAFRVCQFNCGIRGALVSTRVDGRGERSRKPSEGRTVDDSNRMDPLGATKRMSSEGSSVIPVVEFRNTSLAAESTACDKKWDQGRSGGERVCEMIWQRHRSEGCTPNGPTNKCLGPIQSTH